MQDVEKGRLLVACSNHFMDNTKLKVPTFVRVACRSMVARERLQFGCTKFGCSGIPTWRIIPFSRWLITMVSKSPK